MPTIWLLFALVYSGYESALNRRRVTALLTEPVAFLALCLTNPVHGLIWTDATLDELDVDLPGEARIAVADTEAFRTAVRNVLENAFEHNDATEPRVDVAVAHTGDGLRIEITDNGRGLPDRERSVLEDGLETPLNHSEGLGLWLARQSEELSGAAYRSIPR